MAKSKKNNNTAVKIIPLGGLNEIGKNITIYETESDIIVVDCGIAFPEDEMLGIDVVIPDFTYLRKNASKIRALLVTHGHEDHIGAIPYFLREFSVPVYATRLTIGLIENKLKEHKLKPSTTVIKAGEIFSIGDFTIDPIRVTHSIADCVAFAISTPQGVIIHTGDFKIDHTPIDGQRMELSKLASYGERGVLALLSDSTNVLHSGYTMSESSVGDTFENLFRHTTNRIIVASFASNIHRIQQIANAAMLNNRKIAFSGRSMLSTTAVAIELGYLKIPQSEIIDIKDVERYPDNEIVIVTTGSQGEPLAALSRMANNEHKNVEIRQGDMVILSSSPIPGNEKSVYKIINQLTFKGANVIYSSLAEVHVSGHARREELKMMLALTKPKYFIPVHGEFIHLDKHAALGVEMGIPSKNTFVLSNGSCLEFSGDKATTLPSVPASSIFVDGFGIGDVGVAVLRDRKLLSEDGLICVVATIDKQTKTIISGPEIVTRGFVYIKESEALLEGLRQLSQAEITRIISEDSYDFHQLRVGVRNKLGQFIYQQTKREPVLLTMFMEI